MKKYFVFFTAVVLCATMAQPAIAALQFPTVADLNTGTLIKSASSSTVYYFGRDEQRYGFPNEATFYTWYDNFNGVKTISTSQMNDIPLGGMVTYRPQFGNDGASTRLLKLSGKSTVYVPIGYGMLVAIKNEDQANRLFGSRWMDLIDILPDAFVSHYTILGGNLADNASFISDNGYTLADDLELSAAVGIMMYEDPLRFTGYDETITLKSSGDYCTGSYCGYNVVTVEQGGTVKFVNYTTDTLTIREKDDNLFSTGEMQPEDIVVLTIDLEPGEYNFRADEAKGMVGVLVVE